MRISVSAGAVALLATVTATSSSALANEIVFNVFTGPSHYINGPFKAWAKDVERVTSGRVTVKFLPTNAAPPPKQVDAVVSGQFDAAFVFNAFTAKLAPGPQFGLLPFVLRGNAEQGSVAYWRTYNKFFGAKNELKRIGVHILSVFQFPGGQHYSGTDTPISSIADLKTRKIWALAGTPSRTLKLAGVNHVSGPAARVNEFTQTNVVDGLISITLDAVRAFGAQSFVKSATIMKGALQAASFTMIISDKKWTSISEADRKAITEISGEKIARAVGKSADKADEDTVAEMKKAGIKFVDASAAFEDELEKAGQPLTDAWIKKVKAKGIDGKAVIANYKDEVKKLQASQKK